MSRAADNTRLEPTSLRSVAEFERWLLLVAIPGDLNGVCASSHFKHVYGSATTVRLLLDADLVELEPNLDHSGLSALVGARLLAEVPVVWA